MDRPYVTSDGIVLGDRGSVVVKIGKKSLKEVWRKRADLISYGGYGDVVCLRNGRDFQLWNADGKVVWKRQFPTTPFRRENRLWLIHEGHVEAVDFTTGQTLEQSACPTGYASFVSDDGRVILFRPSPLDAEPVLAFEFSQRRVLWERKLVAEIRERYRIECPEGLVFQASSHSRCIAASGRHVFGVIMENGELCWAQSLGSRAPHIRDGRLYGWSTSSVAATKRRTLNTVSGAISRETVGPDTHENRFVVLAEETGEILVDRPLESYGATFDRFLEPSQGTLCRDHVAFTVADTGLLVVFRLSDGEMIWHYEHGDELFSPVFDDNRLYVCCADGTLVVFEAEGEEL